MTFVSQRSSPEEQGTAIVRWCVEAFKATMSQANPARCCALAGVCLLMLSGCANRNDAGPARSLSVARSAREVRLMTFNLRVRTILDGSNIWDRRRDSVVEHIRSFDADLV